MSWGVHVCETHSICHCIPDSRSVTDLLGATVCHEFSRHRRRILTVTDMTRIVFTCPVFLDTFLDSDHERQLARFPPFLSLAYFPECSAQGDALYP